MKVANLFEVHGPFPIPVEGRTTNYVTVTKAWRQQLVDDLGGTPQSFRDSEARAGLYLLGRSVGRTVHYFYIGKSGTDLRNEVTQPHKKVNIDAAMRGEYGLPVVTFIVYRRHKHGRACDDELLKEMERYLIQQARMGGNELRNRHHNHDAKWAVVGLTVRPAKGNIPAAAADLKAHLSLGRPPRLDE